MNPSTELVSIAFGRRYARSPHCDPSQGSSSGLTQPESACQLEGVCKAVDRLPIAAKTWAYFAYDDGGGAKMDQAGAVVYHVCREIEWSDPSEWENDDDTAWRKIAVINHVVRDVYRRRGITSADLGRETQLLGQYFAPGRPWGRYRAAVDQCLEGWTQEMLTSVSYALDNKAA